MSRAESPWPRRSAAAVALLLPGLLALLAGLAFARPSLAMRVDAPRAEHYLTDFRETETNPTDTYRWSQRRGALLLDGLAHAPLLVELRMTSPRPPDAPPADLQVERGVRAMGAFRVAGDWRRYRMLLPPAPDGDPEVRLRMPTFNPEGGRRGIGLALSEWRVLPIDRGPAAAGAILGGGRIALLLFLPALAAAAAHGITRRLRIPQRAQIAVVAMAALSGAAGTAFGAAVPIETVFWLPEARLTPLALLALLGARLSLPDWFTPFERRLHTALSDDRRCLRLVVAAALLQGAIYVVLLPPWQHYDEPAHFEYAWMIANSSLRPAPESIPPEIAALGGAARAFGHPPGYHMLVALPLRLAGGLDIIGQLYVGRSVSLLLFALTVAMIALALRDLTPTRHPLRWAVPLAVVLLPTFADLMTGVNNDVGAIAAFTLFLWGAIRLIQNGLNARRVMWVFGAAILCALMKNTAAPALAFAPVALLIAVWQGRGWRWRRLIALTLLPPLLLIAASINWDDAALWYGWGATSESARALRADAPFGSHALRLEGRPDWGPQGLSNPLFVEDARRFAGGTITVGGWVWASRPASVPGPGVMFDRGDFNVVVVTPPISVTTTPTFVAWQFEVPESTGSLHYFLSAAIAPGDAPVTIYADGAVLAAGRYPAGEAPQFDDDAARGGVWGGERFINLVRNPSAEGVGPRLRGAIERTSYAYLRRSPSQFLVALLDVERTGRIILFDVAPWMIFALFGAYAWSQVRLEGGWWPWVCGVAVAGGLAGSLWWWVRRRARAPAATRAALAFLALVALALWANAALRALPLLRTEPLPFPRYAFPAILPTVLVLIGGWGALLRGGERGHRGEHAGEHVGGHVGRHVGGHAGPPLLLAALAALNCLAIATIRGFFL
jgi:hypothetical protein